MDLETENRLAALLMEEARRLRFEAEKEGVHVYLRQPNVRGRPNSRFLTATVLGVQQANRAVEVTEMWRAREKELELQAKLEDRSKEYIHKRRTGEKHHTSSLHVGSSSRHKQENRNSVASYSSSKQDMEHCCSYEDDGLRDEEVEEFLHTRAKRGRGVVGSRMDEAGPYLSRTSSDQDADDLLSHDVRLKEDWESRILGPEKPSFLKLDSPLNDSDTEKKVCSTNSSSKHHSKHRRLKKEKSEKRKRKEKRSKHDNKSRRTKD